MLGCGGQTFLGDIQFPSASECVGQGRAGGPAPRAHCVPLPTGPWEGCRTDGAWQGPHGLWAAPSASVTAHVATTGLNKRTEENTCEGPGPPLFYEVQKGPPLPAPTRSCPQSSIRSPPRPSPNPLVPSATTPGPKHPQAWEAASPEGSHGGPWNSPSSLMAGTKPSASSLFCPRAQEDVSLLSPQCFPTAPSSVAPEPWPPSLLPSLDPATGAGL